MNIVFMIGILITVLTLIPVLLQLRTHPKGLFICFFAEMWERFSFYGMRALLIYYLTKHFLFSDGRASEQYGSYTTLVYLLPLIGGVVADRFIGTRRAIIFGGILLVIGHFGMAIEGTPNQQTLTYQGTTYEFVKSGSVLSGEVKLKLGEGLYDFSANKEGGLVIEDLPAGALLPSVLPKDSYQMGVVSKTPWAEQAFYLATAFIALGVGFLKPNISSLVGQLYKDRDPRRDSGFQLYYFGINLGAFWAGITCGYLGETVGWWAGFGLAGLGMLAGLLVFILGKSWLEGKGEAADSVALKEKLGGFISRENLIYLCGILGVPVVYFMMQKNSLVGLGLGLGFVCVMAYVFYEMATKLSRIENYRLGLALILSLASVVFFTLFEQAGSSLALFAERNTNLNILGQGRLINILGLKLVLASAAQLSLMSLPAHYIWVDMSFTASQTQVFNSGFILIFAPVFAWVFTFLAKRRLDPDPVKKFSFGLINVGLGFLILVWAAPLANGAFQVPLLFLMLTYLLHTFGELALSPVGLSQQTKLSPPALVSTMMAIWFLGSAGAQYLAGFIAKMAATQTVGGQVLDAEAALATSLKTFEMIGLWGIGLGVLLFALSFVLKGWAHGVNDYQA
jgi:proton-dependent oligopeptide transporter, POT family